MVMIYVVILLTILLITASLIAYVFFHKSEMLFDKLEEVTEQTEKSLDILNDRYRTLSEMAQIPVLIDDPIVKKFIFEMKQSINALLLVANLMVESDENDENQNDTTND